MWPRTWDDIPPDDRRNWRVDDYDGELVRMNPLEVVGELLAAAADALLPPPLEVAE